MRVAKKQDTLIDSVNFDQPENAGETAKNLSFEFDYEESKD